MGVSGRLYAEATLSQKIDDWCASHVRCFEDMGWAPRVVVPDNVTASLRSGVVTKLRGGGYHGENRWLR